MWNFHEDKASSRSGVGVAALLPERSPILRSPHAPNLPFQRPPRRQPSRLFSAPNASARALVTNRDRNRSLVSETESNSTPPRMVSNLFAQFWEAGFQTRPPTFGVAICHEDGAVRKHSARPPGTAPTVLTVALKLNREDGVDFSGLANPVSNIARSCRPSCGRYFRFRRAAGPHCRLGCETFQGARPLWLPVRVD
jgi:hypothetical protein